MSLVCSICHNALLTPASGQRGGPDTMAATCGHMLHNNCLQTFLKARKDPKLGTACPYCKKPVGPAGFFQLFPIFAGDYESKPIQTPNQSNVSYV